MVAIQPGHWKIEELPDKQAHRRGSTGAAYGTVREADINRAVTEALIPKLEGEGWKVLLIPATVPPELRADAFVSIHADGGNGLRQGWKLAPSWMPSQAARDLASALHSSFASEKELVEDKDGVTIFMRGYYGFNYRRYHHAVGPYTPSVLVELGFVSNARDRKLLTTRPEYFATLIHRGLKSYFQDRKRDSVADLLPLELSRYLTVGQGGVVVRSAPRPSAPKIAEFEPGSILRPVDESGDWYEVFVRSHRTSGWLTKSEVHMTRERDWPSLGGRDVTIFNTVPGR